MKVFLTGATGFVGRHMVARLLERGHSVRALVRTIPTQPKAQTQVEYVRGDVVSGEGLDAGTIRRQIWACRAG